MKHKISSFLYFFLIYNHSDGWQNKWNLGKKREITYMHFQRDDQIDKYFGRVVMNILIWVLSPTQQVMIIKKVGYLRICATVFCHSYWNSEIISCQSLRSSSQLLSQRQLLGKRISFFLVVTRKAWLQEVARLCNNLTDDEH